MLEGFPWKSEDLNFFSIFSFWSLKMKQNTQLHIPDSLINIFNETITFFKCREFLPAGVPMWCLNCASFFFFLSEMLFRLCWFHTYLLWHVNWSVTVSRVWGYLDLCLQLMAIHFTWIVAALERPVNIFLRGD